MDGEIKFVLILSCCFSKYLFCSVTLETLISICQRQFRFSFRLNFFYIMNRTSLLMTVLFHLDACVLVGCLSEHTVSVCVCEFVSRSDPERSS